MIKKVEDYSLIIPLWQEAFGDTEEDIEFFCNTCKHKVCYAYFEGEKPVSMLFLVDCKCKNNTAGYVYAACTLKSYRGKGLMKTLLDYCKISCRGNLCLIPADEGLIEYYKKQGLIEVIDINDITFDENEEICEYLFEGCELKEPIGLLYSKGV